MPDRPWEKPSLDVVPGSNIVMRHEFRDSSTIWRDSTDKDPKRRYKALIFTKRPRRGLELRMSADGIHWSDPVAHSKNIGDRTSFFHNPFRNVWVYSLRVGKGKYGRPRTRVYREHPDVVVGLHWKEEDGLYEQHTDLFPWVGTDRLDPHHPNPQFAAIEPQLYNLDAVAYESLLLGLFSIWQGPENNVLKQRRIQKRNEVLLGFSRDGFHWHRPHRRPFAPVEEKDGAWNWGNVQSAGDVSGDGQGRLSQRLDALGRNGRIRVDLVRRPPAQRTGAHRRRRHVFLKHIQTGRRCVAGRAPGPGSSAHVRRRGRWKTASGLDRSKIRAIRNLRIAILDPRGRKPNYNQSNSAWQITSRHSQL